MDASASEALEDPGSNIPFLFEPILVEIEGTHYVCLIVPRPLADLLALKRPSGRSVNDGGGSGSGVGNGGRRSGVRSSGGRSIGSSMVLKGKKVGAPGGDVRVRLRYDAHVLALSLQDGEKAQAILAGKVLPTPHDHILCNNWHLYCVCWEDCERTNLHIPTPLEVATAIAGLLKTAQRCWHKRLQPSGDRPSST